MGEGAILDMWVLLRMNGIDWQRESVEIARGNSTEAGTHLPQLGSSVEDVRWKD